MFVEQCQGERLGPSARSGWENPFQSVQPSSKPETCGITISKISTVQSEMCTTCPTAAGTAGVCKGSIHTLCSLCARQVLLQRLWEMGYNILQMSWTVRKCSGKTFSFNCEWRDKVLTVGTGRQFIAVVSVHVRAVLWWKYRDIPAFVAFSLCLNSSAKGTPLPLLPHRGWSEQEKQNHLFLKRSSPFHLLLLICFSEAMPVHAT